MTVKLVKQPGKTRLNAAAAPSERVTDTAHHTEKTNAHAHPFGHLFLSKPHYVPKSPKYEVEIAACYLLALFHPPLIPARG